MKSKFDRYDWEANFYIVMVALVVMYLVSGGTRVLFVRGLLGMIVVLCTILAHLAGRVSANQRHKEQAAEKQK